MVFCSKPEVCKAQLWLQSFGHTRPPCPSNFALPWMVVAVVEIQLESPKTLPSMQRDCHCCEALSWLCRQDSPLVTGPGIWSVNPKRKNQSALLRACSGAGSKPCILSTPTILCCHLCGTAATFSKSSFWVSMLVCGHVHSLKLAAKTLQNGLLPQNKGLVFQPLIFVVAIFLIVLRKSTFQRKCSNIFIKFDPFKTGNFITKLTPFVQAREDLR